MRLEFKSVRQYVCTHHIPPSGPRIDIGVHWIPHLTDGSTSALPNRVRMVPTAGSPAVCTALQHKSDAELHWDDERSRRAGVASARIVKASKVAKEVI